MWITFLYWTAASPLVICIESLSSLSCGRDTSARRENWQKGAGKEKYSDTHKRNLADSKYYSTKNNSFKDGKWITCKNGLRLQKPSGDFQTLTALVMLHCLSKGHTQQIALATVQKQALLEWQSRQPPPPSHPALMWRSSGVVLLTLRAARCVGRWPTARPSHCTCCSAAPVWEVFPPSHESRPSMQKSHITVREAMWLMNRLWLLYPKHLDAKDTLLQYVSCVMCMCVELLGSQLLGNPEVTSPIHSRK